MAVTHFRAQNFLIRLVAALILVFATYNPERPWSYFYWATMDSFTVYKAFVGIVLVIAWVIFIRATSRSLGVIGTLLGIAFFTLLLWLIVDLGWVAVDNIKVMTYLILIALSGLLATGLSWSHIRRRITGQLDVDEVDEP